MANEETLAAARAHMLREIRDLPKNRLCIVDIFDDMGAIVMSPDPVSLARGFIAIANQLLACEFFSEGGALAQRAALFGLAGAQGEIKTVSVEFRDDLEKKVGQG